MRSSPRPVVLSVLVATVLTGCSLIGPQHSQRLQESMLTAAAVPEWHEVTSADVTELAERPPYPRFRRVEPRRCAETLASSWPALVPEGFVEVAAQNIEPFSPTPPTTAYTYSLASGRVLDEGHDPAALRRLPSDCFNFSGSVDGTAMRGVAQEVPVDDLFEEGAAVLLTLTEDEPNGSTQEVRVAWGRASGARITLVAVTRGASASPVSPGEAAVECASIEDDDANTACMRDTREQAADDAAQARGREFEEVLTAAVTRLEE